MDQGRLFTILAAATLTGCSTAPRSFTPMMAETGSQTVDADLAECQAQVAAGRTSDPTSGRTASVVAGSAVGVGAGLAVGASAASGAGMMGGVAGAAGLATGFIVAAPIGVVVISKKIRARKERAIQAATAECLQERGHTVAAWRRTPKG